MHLGAGAGPLVDRAKNQALWLWGPMVLGLLPATCSVELGPAESRAIAGPLMHRAVSQDLCLKVSGGPIAAVSQLRGRAGF